MAGDFQTDRKSQLIAELERSRSDLARNLRSVKADLNVAQHLKHAFFRQKTVWLTGAALSGWILSKLSFRKKKEKPSLSNLFSRKPKDEAISAQKGSGLLLAALSLAGTLLKPVITSYATQKLAEYAAGRDQQPNHPANGAPPRYRR